MREIREMDLGHYKRKAVTEPERKCGIKLRLSALIEVAAALPRRRKQREDCWRGILAHGATPSDERVRSPGASTRLFSAGPMCTNRLIRKGCAFGKRDTVSEVRQERERSHQPRCCARDGGRPSEAGLQEHASNNHKLRWSKARVAPLWKRRDSIASCVDQGDERK